MKIKFAAVTALSILGIGLVACDSAAKLASDIQGSWTGAPEKLITDNASASSLVPVLTLLKTDKKSGEITVNAMISASGQSQSATITTPVTLSVSGQASITGKWTATDDDEIYVNLNPATLSVSIDPDAVIMSTDILTGAENVTPDSLKASLMPAIKARMTSAVQHQFLQITKIDDIKIKNGVMTCEINKKDMAFHNM